MNESRFHCEINSIKVEGMMVKFNIFGDTLTQVTADLEQVIDYVTGGAPASGSVPGAAKAPAKAAAQPPASKVGTCVNCGSDLLEWVTGTRKDNQRPFAAFKCQQCGTWQPAVKK